MTLLFRHLYEKRVSHVAGRFFFRMMQGKLYKIES